MSQKQKKPNYKNKLGFITNDEKWEENHKKVKANIKPVYFLDKNTHTGEIIKRLVHA